MADKMKISALAIIKDCKIASDGAKMSFEGLQFTCDQYREIAELIKEAIPVMVTITETNKKLPFGDDATMEIVDPKTGEVKATKKLA